MLRKVIAAVCVAAVPAAASAADLGPAANSGYVPYAAVNWTGLYVGGHAGYGWGNVNLEDTLQVPETNLELIDSGKFTTGGFLGGGQVGYNVQFDRIVLGAEADFGYMGLNGSENYPAENAAGVSVSRAYKSSGGYYGDITGRAGFTLDNSGRSDRILIYAKGGAAFINSKYTSSYSASGFGGSWTEAASYSASGTYWGWTAGGGVEYAINPSWSLKAEYQHFDFGSTSFATVGKISSTFSPTVDSVTAGVNYHFRPDVQPLK